MVVKLCINDVKTGKSYNKELAEGDESIFMTKKIKDKIDGSSLGFSGYEFEISGGSDSAGFPMRYDVQGTSRKRILLTDGVGVNINRKGMRKRKSIRGNTINDETHQINLKVIKAGSKGLAEVLGLEVKEESKTEEKKTEVKEEKKEEKTTEKKEEKKVDKPKEAKPEVKKEKKEVKKEETEDKK
ncbi:30S ribosomal protein S6e [archaeon]|nr:30S ribosomal protein S6e [archaeon]